MRVIRHRDATLVALVLALVSFGCGGDTAAPVGSSGSTTEPPSPTSSASPADPCGIGHEDFPPIPAGVTCTIDVGGDEAPPIRVEYTIPAEGWREFIGAFKDVEEGGDLQRVNMVYADVENLTTHACTDQDPLIPPVGPSVADLADALTRLPPFEVMSPPTDVTVDGYDGQHVTLRVPIDQPYDEDQRVYDGCGELVLRTWIAPPLSYAFYGYSAPGTTEDFWILDVDGTRLVMAALTSSNASPELVAERQQIFDSINIGP
jgi:hypothetical protein